MFGDFFQNFKLNFPFLGADNPGGVFGHDPEKAMQDVLKGTWTGGGQQQAGGMPGAPGAPGASTVARPAPAASGVAQPPMPIGGSALAPGAGSPLGPGQRMAGNVNMPGVLDPNAAQQGANENRPGQERPKGLGPPREPPPWRGFLPPSSTYFND